MLPQGVFKGPKANPSLEQRGQEQGRPRVVGREHACRSTPLAQVRQQIVENRLFVTRKKTPIRRQRGEFLIHPCAPCWHASTHVLTTRDPLVEAAVGGGAEGEVITGRRG